MYNNIVLIIALYLDIITMKIMILSGAQSSDIVIYIIENT